MPLLHLAPRFLHNRLWLSQSCVEKRQGRTYGPPGGKIMTVFIDDISMPAINEWNDQVCKRLTACLVFQCGPLIHVHVCIQVGVNITSEFIDTHLVIKLYGF